MPRSIDPRILQLNAGFLLAHGLAPLDVEAGRLTLGMRDPGDAGAIAAVRFATGLEIDPIAIDDSAWVHWRQSLSQLRGTASDHIAATDTPPCTSLGDGPAITIRLSEHEVQVVTDRAIGTDREITFAAADHAVWSHLARQVGGVAMAMVILLDDVVCEVELPELPQDGRALRRALDLHSPLRVENLAWSLPAPVHGSGAVRLGLVRKAWLDDRITAITTALKPGTVIVQDEAGRRFDLRPVPPPRPPIGALAVGAAAGATAVALLVGIVGLLGQPRAPTLAGGATGIGRPPASIAVPLPLASAMAVPPPAMPPRMLSQAQDQSTRFELVGVAGRLPDDAVALVRPAWGKTVILRVGDSLLGWRLAAIAADRVTLAKGEARREIVLEPAAMQGGQSR